jgi:peptidoglycan/LPS O-acetylase OafA/YrhL
MPRPLPALTSLRFFAALWVLLFDYWGSSGWAWPAAIARGQLGVELFFVLSGFILCHVYLDAFGERRFAYGEFLWTRLARIGPVHLVTLAGIGLLAGLAAAAGMSSGDKVLVWPSLPAELTLTQAWGLAPLGGWNHPSWSISAEWFAYLAFPLFAVAAWRLRRRPRTAVAIAMAFMVALEGVFPRLAGFPLTRATTAWGALRIVPCFALGCAAFLAWRADPIRRPARALLVSAGTLAAIVAALQLGAPDALLITLFALLIMALASLSSSGSRLLAHPVLTGLGEASFSLYMVAIPWQLVFEKGLARLAGGGVRGPLALLAEALGAILVAWLVHVAIERPARSAMRRHGPSFLARRPAAQPAAG